MMFTCATPGCTDARHDRLDAPLPHDVPYPRGTPREHHAAAKAPRAAASTKVVRDRRGRSLRIDIHCHYLNQAAAAKVAHLNPAQYEPSVTFANALTREVNVKQIRDRLPKLSTIETRLKDMDRMGIDMQAVSPAPNQCYYWTEPELGLELSRMVNDRLAEIVATWPERFVALGTVPLQRVDLAVAELERCVKELGLRGVEINPSVNGMDLTDPRLKLEKFFAKAQALDVVIFMHPIGFTQGERLVDHYFNNVIGNPMETTIAASHLIFDGVMQRHPKLKIVLPHAGGYLAHYWARMDHAHRARPDCRTVIKRPPSSYLAKMYFDTITFDPGMLRHMIDRFGPEHVLLGTDYPYDMGVEDPLGLIRSVRGLKRADREIIEGGNAARLLKIKRPRNCPGHSQPKPQHL
jgi:aminocarboxymuconate-semialdehyde decarboxylase